MASVQAERLRYCEIMTGIVTGRGSLSFYLNSQAKKSDNTLNHALLQEYCFGVCRWFHKLDGWSRQLLDKPLRNKDRDIHLLILLGLYQLQYMRTPAHAAINETVNAVQALKKDWARNLVNAVLRQAQRSLDELEAQAEKDYSLKYSHPGWMLDLIKHDWPACYRDILQANNERAPMTLRVNCQKLSRQDYLQQLQDVGIKAQPGRLTGTAVILDQPIDISQLPGFAEGLVSVQDEASQLLPTLLTLRPGMKVLDACAAPGGKTCALLEAEPELQVTCLDNDSKRLPRLSENLLRCKLQAAVHCGDICDTSPDSAPFDLILLDVPCSASGVIRRHPDIKLLRTPDEVVSLQQRQQALLRAAWPLLKEGGQLLYSTCSVFRAENQLQIEAFCRHLQERKLAFTLPTLDCEFAADRECGMQLLPGAAENDGFYYALLRK